MDLLSTLNPAQREAVQLVNGPILVLAGPGSGKTRVLTHRVAYLIQERHIAPYNILAVTFTNKAAREMRERLIQLIGEAHGRDLTIGTFHATCARFLRRDGERVGLGRDFAIYDDDDQTALIKQILKELNLNDKAYRPGAVLGAISKAKNDLVAPADYAPPSHWHEAIRRAYVRYQQLLAQNNAADFDDLLVLAVRLLRENPDVLARYQNRYAYLHVDEFQDTNSAQYTLMKLLADKYQNLFCVGDEDQCLVPGTQIQTPTGLKPVETIRRGDLITVAAGRGATMPLPVARVHHQKYRGKIIEIRTQRGYTLRVTPNHMLFARLGLAEEIYYVYLMCRIDRGYRIGIAQGTRSNGVREQPFTGLVIRGNQENADKVWILRVCRSKSEAAFYEQYYSFSYGIPTTVFHGVGRAMRMSEEQIAQLFDQIDTRQRAARLMADLALFPEYPHHRPKGIAGERSPHRIVVNLRLFGDTRRTNESPWNAHRVSLNTTDRQLEAQLCARGFHTRAGRRQTWRIESSNLAYDQADAFARQLALQGGDLEIARCAFLTNAKSVGGLTLPFDFQPASHIHPTMILPVLENGEIVDDPVVEVTWQDYAGLVYDLDIDKVHNYLADGIVVHNSVYGWRGADYRNVLRFAEDFPNAQVRLLEQNYRSTQTILDVAQAVIRKNKSRHPKKLWTENPAGVPITLYEAYDQDEEAQFVVDEIARLTRAGVKPRDCAIFYRTNAQSRALESMFTRRGMAYQLIGGFRFYQRREVKDLLAYLRLTQNPEDSVAFTRILNVPARGIGKTTMDAVMQWANRQRVAPLALLQQLRDETQRHEAAVKTKTAPAAGSDLLAAFDARARKPLIAFVNLIESVIAARADEKLSALLELLIQKIAYADHLRDGTEEGEDRWENVAELVRATQRYQNANADVTLPLFLEEAALQSDIDTMKDEANAPTLMTLHTAKGLEFKIVFIVGLEEGLFPHSRALEDPAQMEEERRLCYVGITRAKEKLYLVRAFRRALYGSYDTSTPSRFLADVPRTLTTSGGKLGAPTGTGWSNQRAAYHRTDEDQFALQDDAAEETPRPARRTQRADADFDFDDAADATPRRRTRASHSLPKPPPSLPRAPTQTPAPQFRAGDKVQHPNFGDGVVIASKITGADEEVQIAFVGIGVKRLIARYANLTRK